MTSAKHRKFPPGNAGKIRARIVSAKEFWTPERIAEAKRDFSPPPRYKEFLKIMRKVEGTNLVRIF